MASDATTTTGPVRLGGRRAARPRPSFLNRTFVAAVLTTAFIVPFERESAAFAAEYPTWEEVQAARASESAKRAEVGRIQGLISSLEQQVTQARTLAEQRGAEYELATIAYDDAVYRADQLGAAAEEASATADESNRRAAALASQLARTGGSQLQLSLFAGGARSDDLLYRLAAMSRIAEKTGEIYEQASQDRNTAQTLTDQADVARAAREALRIEAEAALQAAIEAQTALEASLVEQQARSLVLAGQLEVLTKDRETTEAEYQAGVEERRRQAEAAAAAERERRAREGDGGGYVVGPGGQGWSDPLPGHRVTSEWGNRLHPIDRVWRLHAGIDLVKGGGGTCGATVYAASSGRVVYAGYNGGLGNAVEIDHGGGRRTVYGHNTTVLVRSGSEVSEGQPIAYAGTTGASTGCHVHFETRVNGASQNPRQFMAQYGVGL